MAKIFDLFSGRELNPADRQNNHLKQDMAQAEIIAENIMAAEKFYEEYLEKINEREMSIDEAIEDIGKKFKQKQINQEVRDDLIKRLNLLREQ